MQNYTKEQIQALLPEQIKALLPEQIQALTAVQLVSLIEIQIAALEQIKALSDSMKALNVNPTSPRESQRASSWTEVAVKETKIIEQEIGKY